MARVYGSVLAKLQLNDALHLHCFWHVKRAWTRRYSSHHQGLLDAAMAMAMATEKKVFDALYQTFIEKYGQEEVGSRFIQLYGHHGSESRPAKWARSLTKGKQVTHNLHLERYHLEVKKVLNPSCRLDSVVAGIEEINKRYFEKDIRVEEEIRGVKPSKFQKKFWDLHQSNIEEVGTVSIITEGQYIVNSHVSHMQYTVNDIVPLCSAETCKVKCTKCDPTDSYGGCAHAYECTCPGYGLSNMCKHIHWVQSYKTKNGIQTVKVSSSTAGIKEEPNVSKPHSKNSKVPPTKRPAPRGTKNVYPKKRMKHIPVKGTLFPSRPTRTKRKQNQQEKAKKKRPELSQHQISQMVQKSLSVRSYDDTETWATLIIMDDPSLERYITSALPPERHAEFRQRLQEARTHWDCANCMSQDLDKINSNYSACDHCGKWCHNACAQPPNSDGFFFCKNCNIISEALIAQSVPNIFDPSIDPIVEVEAHHLDRCLSYNSWYVNAFCQFYLFLLVKGNQDFSVAPFGDVQHMIGPDLTLALGHARRRWGRKNHILLPHFQLNHFQLVYARNDGKSVYLEFFDPIPNIRTSTADAHLSKIQGFFEQLYPGCTVHQNVRNDIPVQRDSVSCGPLMCMIAKCIVFNLPMPPLDSVTPTNMGNLRLLQRHEVINKSVSHMIFPDRLTKFKRFINLNSTTCWLNSSVQVILAAQEHGLIDNIEDSRLGRELKDLSNQTTKCSQTLGGMCQILNSPTGEQDPLDKFFHKMEGSLRGAFTSQIQEDEVCKECGTEINGRVVSHLEHNIVGDCSTTAELRTKLETCVTNPENNPFGCNTHRQAGSTVSKRIVSLGKVITFVLNGNIDVSLRLPQDFEVANRYYDLYAILTYIGHTTTRSSTGHYLAKIKTVKGAWVVLDSERVILTYPKDLTNNAHILFYKARI